MAEYLIRDTTLDAIADAINAKTGGSSAMTPAQMVTAIGTISGGGDPWENLIKLANNTLTSIPAISDFTNVKTGLFYSNSNLTQIDCRNITSVAKDSFYGAGIYHLFFPRVVAITGANCFRNCRNLIDVVFAGGITRMEASMFEQCPNLERIDIKQMTTIASVNISSFYNTPALNALIIRSNTVIPLSGSFPTNCNLATSGNIYVPAAVLDSYKEATNWSTYASRIVAIEGSIYETKYADGTPIPNT